MRFVFQLILLVTLAFSEIACVFHGNLSEGIKCFRIQNYREAFIHLKPEAMKGQPDALYAVGYMYYYGRGVVEDKRQARVWILRAAAKGQPEAIQAVEILKLRTDVVLKDPLDSLIYQDNYIRS